MIRTKSICTNLILAKKQPTCTTLLITILCLQFDQSTKGHISLVPHKNIAIANGKKIIIWGREKHRERYKTRKLFFCSLAGGGVIRVNPIVLNYKLH